MGSFGRRFVAVFAATILFAGCRQSDIITETKHYGTVYDTEYEKHLADDKLHPLLEGWREDAPVYAEPVAICGWKEGVSTWDLHFATNRDAEDSSGDVRMRFGNRVLTRPLYGRANVTLPRRRRGTDVSHEPSGVIRLIGACTKEESLKDLSTIDEVEQTSFETFFAGVSDQVERSRQRDVLLFVHGFNVLFDDCLVRTAQIALDMPFNGAVVCYSWPSQGGVSNYGTDEPINADSVAPFLEFLTQLRSGLDDDVRIHILVHSMGNRIVLQALANWPRESDTPPIANLALLAPDVGISDFQSWAPRAATRCERVTLYASVHDAALIASKSLHVEQRAGDPHPPVIVDGVETIDCSGIDVMSFLGHGYYSANIDVLADLFQLIKRDRPASRRPHLKEVTSKNGRYWKYSTTAQHDLWTWHFDDLEQR